MKNFFNFFFSFDKLFKEKLVPPFFLLAIIVFGLAFFAEALDSLNLGILASIIAFVNFFASGLLGLIIIRIVAELMVAIFRINDNLSPDKGKSELADYDPMGEARKAAEIAAARTREATKTVSEKASEMSDSVQEKAKSATASVREKAEDLSSSAKEKTDSVIGKGNVSKLAADPEPATAPEVKVSEPAPKKKTPAPRKKAAPKKPAAKTTAAKTAPKKRGPKPGSKAPRDADGNLLKKDGTPRKRPGPKAK